MERQPFPKVPSRIPTVILQARKKGTNDAWEDNDPSFFAVFEHERHLAGQRVEDLNNFESHYEWRVKPPIKV